MKILSKYEEQSLNSTEKISLLVANYNNGKYLEECIQAVLNQTSDRWNLYIVDDASTDDSQRIYDKYAGHPSIEIFYNEKNLGLISTIKKLIELSKNDIVGILDPDDKLDYTCVEKIMNYYDKHVFAGFVYTNFWFCDSVMNIRNVGFCKPIPLNKTNLDMNCVSHFKTFKKSIYHKTDGLDERILYAEDKDLIFKIEEVAYLHFMNEPLYYYRVLSQSQGHGEKARKGYMNFQLARKYAYYRRYIDKWNGKKSLMNDIRVMLAKKKKTREKMNLIQILAMENLISASKILTKLEMSYWLTDSTLMGFCYEKNFITNDFSIELGSFIKDYNDVIIMEMIRNGWKFEFVHGTHACGLEICFGRNHSKLKIYFFYEENEKYWHGAWLNTNIGYKLIKYYYDKFNLAEEEFFEYKFNIPQYPLNYLRTKYGEKKNINNDNLDLVFDYENSVKTEIYTV
jgi:glycosyltransferase involved in cell wall biosynthesis